MKHKPINADDVDNGDDDDTDEFSCSGLVRAWYFLSGQYPVPAGCNLRVPPWRGLCDAALVTEEFITEQAAGHSFRS
ncbi:hypothetical protein RHMOL_Rhmol09G0128300 [Rhododendron molle]|uniref:Uncharacterized protein n=1 Tax=Rhododendron molle TaxID=49168 RepID=A0ACC0ME34_RHOML|nr:hypothetical protein RHMOL_Rhmol09G0128300 [Rhododendron molle]